MKIPSRKAVIENIREQGGKIAAVLPYHYPRALLRAHGIFPVEVWGPPHVDDMSGVQHFPEYTCKIVQKGTCFLTGAGGEAVDCILIPHTCDSLQGMASVIRDFLQETKPVLTIYHPRGRRQSDLDFLTRELHCLSKSLSEISGLTPSDRDLRSAMDTEHEAQVAFSKLVSNRNNYCVSDREFYTILRAREYLPAEDFIALISQIPTGLHTPKGVPLMMSGIVAEPLDLFDRLNEFGAHVVGDDLGCCSRRIYNSPIPGDAFHALAVQLMSMPPDPTVSSPYEKRFSHVTERMAATGAKGLLVYDVKFCEPELFYLPMLEKAVTSAGFGFLYVETELSPEIPQTILNRINAFVEVNA